MSNLRSKLIRLAHKNPSIRGDLLPLLKQSAVRKVLTREQIEGLGAAGINQALDKLDKEQSKLNGALIEAGFGHVRLQEIMKMDHPVAQQYAVVSGQIALLHEEIERRYGPGAPSRLPRGFGPIKR